VPCSAGLLVEAKILEEVSIEIRKPKAFDAVGTLDDAHAIEDGPFRRPQAGRTQAVHGTKFNTQAKEVKRKE